MRDHVKGMRPENEARETPRPLDKTKDLSSRLERIRHGTRRDSGAGIKAISCESDNLGIIRRTSLAASRSSVAIAHQDNKRLDKAPRRRRYETKRFRFGFKCKHLLVGQMKKCPFTFNGHLTKPRLGSHRGDFFVDQRRIRPNCASNRILNGYTVWHLS